MFFDNYNEIKINMSYNESTDLLIINESINGEEVGLSNRIIYIGYDTNHGGRAKITGKGGNFRAANGFIYVDGDQIYDESLDKINLRGKEARKYKDFVYRNNNLIQKCNNDVSLTRKIEDKIKSDESLRSQGFKCERNKDCTLSVFDKDNNLQYRETFDGRRF